MNLPPELEAEYPALRLVTAGHVRLGDLDTMSIDDVDDLNITLTAEADANRRVRRKMESRSR